MTTAPRYVVMSPEGPTQWESDYLQQCVDRIVTRLDHFVWDRQQNTVAAHAANTTD